MEKENPSGPGHQGTIKKKKTHTRLCSEKRKIFKTFV